MKNLSLGRLGIEGSNRIGNSKKEDDAENTEQLEDENKVCVLWRSAEYRTSCWR